MQGGLGKIDYYRKNNLTKWQSRITLHEALAMSQTKLQLNGRKSARDMAVTPLSQELTAVSRQFNEETMKKIDFDIGDIPTIVKTSNGKPYTLGDAVKDGKAKCPSCRGTGGVWRDNIHAYEDCPLCEDERINEDKIAYWEPEHDIKPDFTCKERDEI